jgi:hypothetical protein
VLICKILADYESRVYPKVNTDSSSGMAHKNQ